MGAEARLARVLADLPDEAMVPVGWVRGQLEVEQQPAEERLADYTVAEVAEELERAPSTVRGWLNRDELPGAYRLKGREWRIPRDALATFLEAARTGEQPTQQGAPVDLGAWRKHRRGA
jgi:excisionase family DNA binding protein